MSTEKLDKTASIATIMGTVIAALTLAVAILAMLATFFVPEVREWLGLGEPTADIAGSRTSTVEPASEVLVEPSTEPDASATASSQQMDDPTATATAPPTDTATATPRPPAESVTRDEVATWSLGSVSAAEVQSCLNSVHAGPRPYISFQAGDVVPEGALVATDFSRAGKSWSEYPVEPVCYYGDWGLFESTSSYAAPYEGAYWYIVPSGQLPAAFDCSFTDELLKSGEVLQWIDTPIGSGNWSGVQIRLTRAVHMPEGWVAHIGSAQDQYGPLDLSAGTIASIYSPLSCRPIK